MAMTNDLRCAELESSSRLLQARQRSLQHLAQSPHCASRAEAELELARVRETLAATYVTLRQFQRYA